MEVRAGDMDEWVDCVVGMCMRGKEDGFLDYAALWSLLAEGTSGMEAALQVRLPYIITCMSGSTR